MVTTDPNKYTEYAMAASKGFSYLVPNAVQATLVKLLKRLPTTARPIYREWYGDLMASRACAKDSADAMVTFIEENFPLIREDHNELARLMNEEIDWHEHDYIPVKFPIVGGADESEEREVKTPQNRRDIRPAPAKKSHTKSKRRKTGSSLSAPESELRTNSPSLPLQPLIADEDALGLRSPTSRPSISEPANYNKETPPEDPKALAAARGAPSTTTVGANVEHPITDTKTEVVREERDTDDDGYSYHTGAPEPFNESLRPRGDWSTDVEFMQALERWV